jgi:hypothetical protein
MVWQVRMVDVFEEDNVAQRSTMSTFHTLKPIHPIPSHLISSRLLPIPSQASSMCASTYGSCAKTARCALTNRPEHSTSIV